MSDVIISAENIGKCYTLDHQSGGGGYRKFSDTLIHTAKTPLRWLKAGGGEQRATRSKEEFWALKDVSFEIKRGEVVGIIGRNGAGKSTLLKILSRITEPTKGRITLDGRVASLLEVGTGFHPELTGRENIFLNGAILGMRKEEIRRKFDEIVAFAEIEKFLDTPVKRYSSGMYVRLAFAVAAHLEPEILIVDEVLAVGDAQFQAKCLGKMKEVAEGGGRTVLFVSHNMAAIQTLCSRVVFLKQGKVEQDGAVTKVIGSYLDESAGNDMLVIPRREGMQVQILQAGIEEPDGGDDPRLVLRFVVCSDQERSVCLDVRLQDMTGVPVAFASLGTMDDKTRLFLKPGDNDVNMEICVEGLANGRYLVSIDLLEPYVQYFDRHDTVLKFDLERSPAFGRQRVLLQEWGKGCCELPSRTF